MAGLDIKKPFSESIAPNQDAVRDKISIHTGMQEVTWAIKKTSETVEKMKQDISFSDANTQYTQVSAEADKSFVDFTNGLDMTDISQSGSRINEFVNVNLRDKHKEFISNIQDKEVRKHFQTQMEQDLRTLQKKGLNVQKAAMIKKVDVDVTVAQNNLAEKLRLDSSNENYNNTIALMANHINSLPVSLEKKQGFLNEARRVLSREKIITEYGKDPNKFANYLSISIKKPSKPDDPTSISSLADSSGDNVLSVADDISGSINDPAWNNLDTIERRQLLEHLINGDNAYNSKLRSIISTKARNIDVALNQGRKPKEEELITLADYMKGYGAERGRELFDLQQFKFDMADAVSHIRLMPETEAKEFLHKVADYASDSSNSIETTNKVAKYYQMLNKAHTDSMQELHQDAIKWGIKNGQIDPIRFDTIEDFADSTAQRLSFLKEVKGKYGIVGSYFSGSEEKLLKDQLMKRPASEMVDMVQQSYQLLTDGDKQSVSTAYDKLQDNTLASALSLSTEFSGEANRSAHTIIVGAKNKAEVEKLYKAHPNSDNKSFDTHYTPLIANQLSGLQGNSIGGSFERDAEAIKLFILGNMKSTGDYKLSKNRVDEAIKMVLGNTIVKVNGSSLMPPRGMKEPEFLDRLWTATKQAGEFNPYWCHYMNVGGGRYALVEHGNPKLDKEGNPIIINSRDVPTNKVMEANKEREQARELRRMESDTTFNEWAP
ncbi:MAG: hypothetical protein C4617_05885 [Candidatus Liberibacter europaeus]|uniref:Uncharacterized protein n=1 Tax=Candidatus Liberibacter europaeus TaxID=744859 RepID=A0A2T4VW63_9HYPH|nr:hypothetical protein [Candidatus Liberibacter europaeus]PTL86021.1 MAG: hypothetical protein C4617_05885 [Candidatus Liberibacter europaeus]